MNATTARPVALVTGGSAGLGLALVTGLAAAGWRVITDARNGTRLAEAVGSDPQVQPIAGDVTDQAHRGELTEAVRRAGRLDLLVHNASDLGPTPLPQLARATVDDLDRTWRANVAAPLALTTALLDDLVRSGGMLISISSDAAVEKALARANVDSRTAAVIVAQNDAARIDALRSAVAVLSGFALLALFAAGSLPARQPQEAPSRAT